MVSNHLKSHTTKVESNKQYDEFMVTRLGHIKPPQNIVHIYGQNEGRAGQEKTLEDWTDILTELNNIDGINEVHPVISPI